MKTGATKHWREVLMIATGEGKLSGIGIMEYFAPLYNWLKKHNKKLGLDIGWDSEISKFFLVIRFLTIIFFLIRF